MNSKIISRIRIERSGQAASVLGNLGTNHSDLLGDKIVPLLIPRLNDEDGFVRRYAVLALGNYGRKAVPAVPGLRCCEGLQKFERWMVCGRRFG